MQPVEPIHPPPPTRRPASRALRFAPVGDEPSTALRVAAGYFTLTGALGVISGVGGLVAIATLLTPAVQWALGRGPAAGVLFSLLGAVVVASVWRELE